MLYITYFNSVVSIVQRGFRILYCRYAAISNFKNIEEKQQKWWVPHVYSFRLSDQLFVLLSRYLLIFEIAYCVQLLYKHVVVFIYVYLKH